MRLHCSRQVVLASGLVVVALALSAQALAMDCKTDQDCPTGFQCEKPVFVPGCAQPPDCGPQDPVESETGDCEKAPLKCQSDTDCPSFMECINPVSESAELWITGDVVEGTATLSNLGFCQGSTQVPAKAVRL